MFLRKYSNMMVYPKLYAKNNRLTIIINKKCLEEHNHLIKWRNCPSIMEFGYGDGGSSRESLFPYLPPNLNEFVATDLSPSMLEYARKNTVIPFMKFDELDIATKDVPSKYLEKFDHIFGFIVMHLVRDPRQSFLNMHKMLKPGGSIFLTILEHTLIDHSMDELLSKHPEWGEYGLKNWISPYFYSPNPRQDWAKNLNETGFNNHKICEESGSFEFLSTKEFDDFLLSICVVLPNIPEEKHEEFKVIYRDFTRKGKLISTQVRDGKEILSYNYNTFVIHGTRT